MKKAAYLAIIVLVTSTGAFSFMPNQKQSGATSTPLITQIDNHEARINNLENNVAALQAATNTTPSPDQVKIPVVNTPTNAAVEPVAITVVSYKEIVIDADNSDCEYTYSDGSTHQFHWKITNPKTSFITNAQGNNGRWVAGTTFDGICDNKAIGLPKP